MCDSATLAAALRCPLGLFNFPPDSVLVEDADEEILELYMDLASTHEGDIPDQGGLGFLDSSQAVLQLDLVLKADTTSSLGAETRGEKGRSKQKRGRNEGRSVHGKKEAKEEHIEVRVHQDLAALKGRKGDTGSVLWRSSLHLAQHVLSQHRFPPLTQPPLLDPTRLVNTSVLELGAGTGLLAILLSRLCRAYTASDRLENLRLVARNLAMNSVPVESPGPTGDVLSDDGGRPKKIVAKNSSASSAPSPHTVMLEEVDWMEVSRERSALRQRARRITSPVPSGSASTSDHPSLLSGPSARVDDNTVTSNVFDVVLAVDCIYNENLISPLIDTFAKYTGRGGSTLVWVVVELRSSDVLTLFLETWLSHDSGPWTIVRLGPGAMGQWDGRKPRWVGWIGWR